MNKDLKQKIVSALSDQDLQKGLDKAIKNFKQHRQQALKGIDFKQIQLEIKQIRKNNLDHLSENLNTFKLSCNRNGIILYETTSDQEACSKILEIIKKHNGTKVVKAKSMVSEEIELNEYLKQNGITAIETDLGEWLVQLAEEKPSHITAPAIHMTKERIAKLLNNKFNTNIKPDASEITKFARKKLRDEFITADIGITGANILVAQTGSIIIVTNEGNGRLVSTLPNVHIVITTTEKLVNSMAEAERILNILPKSATGQNITSYVSIISGPSRTADVEKELVIGVHGPEYMYIVLVDNGRSNLLNDQDFKDTLQCLKCGACLGMCPIYQSVGGHVFGRKYMGGIGAILTAFIENIENSSELAKLCSGCGICKSICPTEIDIPSMILKLKSRLSSIKQIPDTKKLIVKSLFSNKMIFDGAMTSAQFFNKLIFNQKSHFEQLPWPLSEFTKFRTIPAFNQKTFSQIVKELKLIQTIDQSKKTLIFYPGCLIEYFYPYIGINTIKLLQKLDYNIIYPDNMTCCGVPALYSGEDNEFKRFADENYKIINQYKKPDINSIVTVCPSCTQGLMKSDAFSDFKIIDISEAILCHLDKITIETKHLDAVSYHPSCHYSKNDRQQTLTHQILKQLYGNSFIEYYDMYNCCGAAGSYALEFPEISEKLISKKLKNIADSGISNLVIDCPGCLMQYQGYLNKSNQKLNLIYVTDIFNL